MGFELHRKGASMGGFQPFVEEVSLAGVTFAFWVGDVTAQKWYNPAEHQSFSEHTETARLIRPGDRVLEIGSHHGFTAMLLSKLVGNAGFVLAVEPSPFNAIMTSAQVTLNRARNCHVIQAAASDRKGRTKISTQSNSRVTDSDHGIEVPTVRVDDLDAEFGPFDVLKVDVEGFEQQVLKGASALLSRLPRIMLELHSPYLSEFGSSIEGVLNMLSSRYRGSFVPRNAREQVYSYPAQCVPLDDVVNLFLQTDGPGE